MCNLIQSIVTLPAHSARQKASSLNCEAFVQTLCLQIADSKSAFGADRAGWEAEVRMLREALASMVEVLNGQEKRMGSTSEALLKLRENIALSLNHFNVSGVKLVNLPKAIQVLVEQSQHIKAAEMPGEVKIELEYLSVGFSQGFYVPKDVCSNKACHDQLQHHDKKADKCKPLTPCHPYRQ